MRQDIVDLRWEPVSVSAASLSLKDCSLLWWMKSPCAWNTESGRYREGKGPISTRTELMWRFVSKEEDFIGDTEFNWERLSIYKVGK